MVTTGYALFPKHLENLSVLRSDDEVSINKAEERYRTATKSCNAFVSILYYRAAFIPEDIFEDFMQLKGMALRQSDYYKELVIDEWKDATPSEIKEKYELAWTGSMKLAITYEEQLKSLRAYISSLDLV